jgi:putative transposase
MSDYVWRTGRKCVFKNFVHLVFVTKYRRNAINSIMLKQMQKIIKETCIQMQAELLEFSGSRYNIFLTNHKFLFSL